MKLPQPVYDGKVSLERALLERRSVRDFEETPLTPAEVSQLLWSAQGLSGRGRYRTVPSAGALYPLEIFLVSGKVEGIAPGVYRYDVGGHELLQTGAGDRRSDLCAAALGQGAIRQAPAALVIAAVFRRTTKKYGERGIRYVTMESGNASQNISLEAVSLGLGTVIIGAFRDGEVKKALGLELEEPLLILPVGRPAD